MINCEKRPKGGSGVKNRQSDSDKASNRKKPSADTIDLFTLLDFDNDDDNMDNNYEQQVRDRRKKNLYR